MKFDVVILGAGPAGLAAARAAGRRSASVALIDDNVTAGGQIWRGAPLIAVPAMIGFAWAGWDKPHLPPGSIGYINVIGAALVIPAGLLAAPWGARLGHGLTKRRLECAFAAFMSCVVLRYLFGMFA